MPVVLKSEILNADVTRLDIYAPRITQKALPGQFVIIRPAENSERIPLTIAKTDIAAGTVTVVVQRVGKTTHVLCDIPAGGSIAGIAGPLGANTHLDGIKKAAVVGGGLGCAIAWPIAEALTQNGAETHMIAGFRNKELVILEKELKLSSKELHLCTDDGSYGSKGFVTDMLASLIDGGHVFDHIFAIGPLIMMKFVSKLAVERGIPVTVSMNPIMLDGTGMCGCCRLTVGGKVKFACVDGPDFDGALVDFDEVIKRNRAYTGFETRKLSEHKCRLLGGDGNE